MNIITSNQNAIVKYARSLHQRKNRAKHNTFLAEGTRTIETLLENGFVAEHIIVTNQYLKQHDAIQNYKQLAVVIPSIMDSISAAKTPSGIIGIFYVPDSKPINQVENGLVLCNITDPGNAGTLIRTAAAMGVKNIIMIDGVDTWNTKVIHASAGTIGQVAILDTTWDALIAHAKDQKIETYALVVSGGIGPEHVSLQTGFLIVGNEAHGLLDKQVSDCTQKITIPMPGNTESLNASVAGSIALYVATKR